MEVGFYHCTFCFKGLINQTPTFFRFPLSTFYFLLSTFYFPLSTFHFPSCLLRLASCILHPAPLLLTPASNPQPPTSNLPFLQFRIFFPDIIECFNGNFYLPVVRFFRSHELEQQSRCINDLHNFPFTSPGKFQDLI